MPEIGIADKVTLDAIKLKVDTNLNEKISNISPIKSIQRGITAGAGNVTISAVDPNKTVVFSKSKGSDGYVAARGNITLTPSSDRPASYHGDEYPWCGYTNCYPNYSGSISGGTTDLTVKEYSAKLINATTISCDGPVEWQVVEYK